MRNYMLLIFATAAALSAQPPMEGPVVGWVWDDRVQAIRAIQGIPGSSLLGDPVDIGFPLASAAIASAGEFALVVSGEGRVFHAGLRGRKPVTAIDVPADAAGVVLSPGSNAAAVLYGSRVLLLKNLSTQPVISADLDLSAAGLPARISVRDDGGGMLGLYPDGAGLIAFDRNGNRWPIASASGARSIQFLDNGQDALIVMDRGVAILEDALGNASLRMLWEGNAESALPSGRRSAVVLTDRGLLAINLTNGEAREFECACQPVLFPGSRLASSVFRVSGITDGPTWLADLSGPQPRTVFVPAADQ
ncbi:MAG: hypothetical protein HYZ37_10580 [Candidatus Solibacter usitatus]|nr:hypothetical protein [Candidatus Solibacter usitatus]